MSQAGDSDTLRVGQTIRRLRKQKKVSLQTLARLSGVAISMLSQIERDMGNPSLRTLTRIREALDVPLSALFDTPASATSRSNDGAAPDITLPGTAVQVCRAVDRPVMQFGSPVMTKELLSAPDARALQFMILTIPPGGTSGPAPIAYRAEKAGWVLEGRFSLQVAGDVVTMEAGDSFQFDGTLPHVFGNPSDATARLIWIICRDHAADM